MSQIKNGGLDQYGVEPFEQQQFETAGVEGVNTLTLRYEPGLDILKMYLRVKNEVSRSKLSNVRA